MKAPCANCPKKGCGSYHDECPDYISFKKSQEDLYKRRKEAKDRRIFITEEVERIKRRSKRR